MRAAPFPEWTRAPGKGLQSTCREPSMSPFPDDLTSLKDDMIAFIEGHGLRRFHGYVDYDEVQCVMWKDGDNPESWKDFVELAKAAGASFLTMDSWVLKREDLDDLVERRGSRRSALAPHLRRPYWFCATRVGAPGMCVHLRSECELVRPLPADGRSRRRFRRHPHR